MQTPTADPPSSVDTYDAFRRRALAEVRAGGVDLADTAGVEAMLGGL